MDQYTHTLASGEADEVGFLGFSVDSIYLDDCHFMLIESDQERGNRGNVDDSDHVGFSWLDTERSGRIVVEYCRIRDRLCAITVLLKR